VIGEITAESPELKKDLSWRIYFRVPAETIAAVMQIAAQTKQRSGWQAYRTLAALGVAMQCGVSLQSLGNPFRIALPCFVFVVRRRGDRQELADRLDPVLISMGVDENQQHFPRRSSSV